MATSTCCVNICSNTCDYDWLDRLKQWPSHTFQVSYISSSFSSYTEINSRQDSQPNDVFKMSLRQSLRMIRRQNQRMIPTTRRSSSTSLASSKGKKDFKVGLSRSQKSGLDSLSVEGITNFLELESTQPYLKGVVVVRTVMPNLAVRRKTSSSYHYSGGGGPYQNWFGDHVKCESGCVSEEECRIGIEQQW